MQHIKYRIKKKGWTKKETKQIRNTIWRHQKNLAHIETSKNLIFGLFD